METTHTLTLSIDSDLNVVIRILDLLITLDVALPDVSLRASGEAKLVVSNLSVSEARFAVLKRRVTQIPGVRFVAP